MERTFRFEWKEKIYHIVLGNLHSTLENGGLNVILSDDFNIVEISIYNAELDDTIEASISDEDIEELLLCLLTEIRLPSAYHTGFLEEL